MPSTMLPRDASLFFLTSPTSKLFVPRGLARDRFLGNVMAGALATRLFGAEARSVAGSGRLRPKSACLKPVLGLSLRTCPA